MLPLLSHMVRFYIIIGQFHTRLYISEPFAMQYKQWYQWWNLMDIAATSDSLYIDTLFCIPIWYIAFINATLGFSHGNFQNMAALVGGRMASQWPRRHIPVDASLCSELPQVRIYGFVAAGSGALTEVTPFPFSVPDRPPLKRTAYKQGAKHANKRCITLGCGQIVLGLHCTKGKHA